MKWKKVKIGNRLDLFNTVILGKLIKEPLGGCLFVYDDAFDEYFYFMLELSVEAYLYGESYI
jgi:hypothetical protein